MKCFWKKKTPPSEPPIPPTEEWKKFADRDFYERWIQELTYEIKNLKSYKEEYENCQKLLSQVIDDTKFYTASECIVILANQLISYYRIIMKWDMMCEKCNANIKMTVLCDKCAAPIKENITLEDYKKSYPNGVLCPACKKDLQERKRAGGGVILGEKKDRYDTQETVY